jgi:hypothetical protein
MFEQMTEKNEKAEINVIQRIRRESTAKRAVFDAVFR